MPRSPISAVLTDVDGTLLTKDKVLTERARSAVEQLRQRGIVFTITSGRPSFGMGMLVQPLGLTMPMAAFNGAVIVLPDLSVLDERLLPDYLAPAVIDLIAAHDLDVWLFRSSDWCVRSLEAPRVARETANIQKPPVRVERFDDFLQGVVKIVGVSEDHSRVAACEAAVQQAFGGQVFAARSQPHYLDVTHPSAHKGVVIERLARYLNIPLAHFAAIGDQPNDVQMFARAGISIAMGNASDAVKARATHVTRSHADEGFANAIEQFILPHAEPAGGPAVKPTGRLHRLGESLWLDNLTRDLLQTGMLERYIRELSLTGLTSNPTIFERALQKSTAYDADIARRARSKRSPEELFLDLALADIEAAADLFRPVYERTAGNDGWVSFEVSPLLADDTAGSLAAAEMLFARVRRPNVMIKIPGTPAGIPAIEEAIFAGIPINVTLLFSREQYLAAAEAYMRGIERRIAAGLSPDVASVASLFVSRWDTLVAGKVPPELHTRLGIAIAQRTYKAYRGLLHSARWQRSYNAGARPQRLLWASTKPKDPQVSELTYIEALIAPFSIVTLPDSTLNAFGERGVINTLLRADGGACEATLARFSALGLDLYAMAEELQGAGTRSFVESWRELMQLLARKTNELDQPRSVT